MIPQIIILDTIPLLVNGKVDRQSLLKSYENTNNNDDDTEIELDIDFDGIDKADLIKARVLFETVGSSIGRSLRSKLVKSANFYELGGNSLNSIFTIAELRKKGYFISITDFISAANLGEIIDNIRTTREGSEGNKLIRSDMKLSCVPLAMHHKDDTIDIITKSFFEKADIEQFIKNDILETDYADVSWNSITSHRLGQSIMVSDTRGYLGSSRCQRFKLHYQRLKRPQRRCFIKL